MKKTEKDREESEQLFLYEVKIAKKDKAKEKEKIDIKTSKKFNEERCSALIKAVEEDIKTIKMVADQFAQDFTFEDFVQDAEGNYSDIFQHIFTTIDIYDHPRTTNKQYQKSLHN